MRSIEAIKTFFERKDTITPNGGRPVSNQEILKYARENPVGATRALAEMCAVELAVTIDDKTA